MKSNNRSRYESGAHDPAVDPVFFPAKAAPSGLKYKLYKYVLIMILSSFFIGGCTANEIPEAGMDAWEKEESSIAAEEAESMMEIESETDAETESESETESEAKADPVDESESGDQTDEKKSKKTDTAANKVKDGFLSLIHKKSKSSDWVKYDDLESAQNASGLIISEKVLTRIKDYDHIEYRAIDNTMIEVIFRDKNGQEGYRFRQGYGTGDISGDNKDYDDDAEYKIGKTIVHTKGSNGHIAVATYTDGELTYAFVGAAYQPTLLELMGMYYLFG